MLRHRASPCGRPRACRTACTPSLRMPAVLHPVSCQQGVSNRTVRAHARQYGKVLDLPADLVRRGVRGGAIGSCLLVYRDGMQGVRGSNPLSSTPGQRPIPGQTAPESHS